MPNNTKAIVALVNEKTDYIESSNVKIINGKAKTKEFSSENKKLKTGVYEVIFTVSTYQNQSDAIQEKLDEDYKNVVGKYLNKSDLGTNITCKQNITIK